jgi:predicted transcriptional regulator
MIQALTRLLPAIESWPEEDQEALAEAARLIEAMRKGVYALSPEEEAAVAEGLAEADRGDFAPDDEIAAIWRRFGA